MRGSGYKSSTVTLTRVVDAFMFNEEWDETVWLADGEFGVGEHRGIISMRVYHIFRDLSCVDVLLYHLSVVRDISGQLED